MAFNDSSYGLFQGSLYLAERDFNGAQTSGFEHLGDVDMFTIDPGQKFEDIEESMTGGGYQSAHIPVSTSLKMKCRALDIKMSNWLRATWGGGGTAVTGASVSGESIVLYNGCMTPLAHPGVSNVVIAGATVTTDYVVDAVNGSLAVPVTSTTIPDGTPLSTTAAYDFAAYRGKIEAFTVGQKFYMARFEGRNAAQGNQPMIFNLRQMTLDLSKVFNLIEKKRFGFDMEGALLQDTTIPIPADANDLSQFWNMVKA